MSYGGESLLDRTVRVHVDAQGTQALLDVQAALNAVDAEIASLVAQHQAGAISFEKFNDETRKAVAEQQRLQAQLEKTENYIKTGSTAMGSWASRSSAMTRSIYLSAQGLEDLQYGFNAVVNNIPMVAESVAHGLGKSAEAGLAFGAAASIIAVGVNSVVIPAFQHFVSMHPEVQTFFETLNKELNPFHVDVYASALERMDQRIEELKDKKIRLAIDDAELNRLAKEVDDLRKATEAANALLNKQTATEAQIGKNIGTDLGTETGRESLRKARETSANNAAENAVGVREKQAALDRLDSQAQAYEQDARDHAGENNSISADASRLAEMARADAEKLREELRTIKGKARKNELGRFDEDLDKARTGIGADQANATKRLLANLRAAGQGGLADTIEHDVANAQSGVGTQAEIEAKGRANSREYDRKHAKEQRQEREAIEQKARQAAETERDQRINKMAGLYRTKEQDSIDKIVASGILEGKATAQVEAEVRAFLKGKMTAGGVEQPIVGDASNQAAKQAIETAQASVMAKGDSPAAGAKALLDDVASKAQRKEAAADRHDDKTAEAERIAKIAADMTGRDNRVTGEFAENLAKRIAKLEDTEGRNYEDAVQTALGELNNRVDAHNDAAPHAMAGRQRRRQREVGQAGLQAQHDFIANDFANAGLGLDAQGIETATANTMRILRNSGDTLSLAQAQMEALRQMNSVIDRQQRQIQQLQNQFHRQANRPSGLPLAPRNGRW